MFVINILWSMLTRGALVIFSALFQIILHHELQFYTIRIINLYTAVPRHQSPTWLNRSQVFLGGPDWIIRNLINEQFCTCIYAGKSITTIYVLQLTIADTIFLLSLPVFSAQKLNAFNNWSFGEGKSNYPVPYGQWNLTLIMMNPFINVKAIWVLVVDISVPTLIGYQSLFFPNIKQLKDHRLPASAKQYFQGRCAGWMLW